MTRPTLHIASPKSAPTPETETRRLLDALERAKAAKAGSQDQSFHTSEISELVASEDARAENVG